MAHWIPVMKPIYKPHEYDPVYNIVSLDWVIIGEQPVTINDQPAYQCSECGIYMCHDLEHGTYTFVTDNTTATCPFCGATMVKEVEHE